MHTQTATAPTVQATQSQALFDRVWPVALIIFMLAVNIAWIVFLGYGLIGIVSLAF